MNIEKRLERAETQAGDDDVVIATFVPAGIEGQDLWRNEASGEVFEYDYLQELQKANPQWVLWCREPYDPAKDPTITDIPPDQWTDEMMAEWDAQMKAIEDAEPAREYRVIRTRLAMGNSVKGYDDRLIALAKEELGLA